MNTNEIQEQRLDFLLKEFEVDAGRDGNIEIPHNMSEKQKILRALMNVRMPKKMPDDVIKVQDEYLRECIEEKGIVTLGDIPVIRDNLSVWQGRMRSKDGKAQRKIRERL